MAGNLTAVSLKKFENQTAAAVDKSVKTVLGLPGDLLPDIGRRGHVAIKPHTFQRIPGFRTSPEPLSALEKHAIARGTHVRAAERTQVLKVIVLEHPVHRYAQVVGFDDRPSRFVQLHGAWSSRVPIPVRAVFSVGNAPHGNGEDGVHLEGSSPRAAQTAGIRYAMGYEATDQERTRFRVSARLADYSRPPFRSAREELV